MNKELQVKVNIRDMRSVIGPSLETGTSLSSHQTVRSISPSLLKLISFDFPITR